MSMCSSGNAAVPTIPADISWYVVEPDVFGKHVDSPHPCAGLRLRPATRHLCCPACTHCLLGIWQAGAQAKVSEQGMPAFMRSMQTTLASCASCEKAGRPAHCIGCKVVPLRPRAACAGGCLGRHAAGCCCCGRWLAWRLSALATLSAHTSRQAGPCAAVLPWCSPACCRIPAGMLEACRTPLSRAHTRPRYAACIWV